MAGFQWTDDDENLTERRAKLAMLRVMTRSRERTRELCKTVRIENLTSKRIIHGKDKQNRWRKEEKEGNGEEAEDKKICKGMRVGFERHTT